MDNSTESELRKQLEDLRAYYSSVGRKSDDYFAGVNDIILAIDDWASKRIEHRRGRG